MNNPDELAGLPEDVREAMTLAEAREVVADVYSDFCNPNFTDRHGDGPRLKAAIAAIDAHLSRAAEPVAWCAGLEATVAGWISVKAWSENEFTTPLYTHPPEPARDAKDAARYRWLRERVEVKREGGFWWLAEMEGGFPCTEDFTGNLDTEIDAAMAQESGDE